MDISQLPPPTDPKAQYITPARESSRHGNRFTEAELRYNGAVGNARRARGEETPSAPKIATPRLNGWKRQLELLS